MNKVVPEIYLQDAKGALEYYEQTLGAYVLDKVYAKDVPNVDQEEKFNNNLEAVVYAELVICENKFIFGEDFDSKKSGNISLWFECDTLDEFNKMSLLAANGEEMFIMDNGHFHITLEDKYNIGWSIHLRKELVEDVK